MFIIYYMLYLPVKLSTLLFMNNKNTVCPLIFLVFPLPKARELAKTLYMVAYLALIYN